VEFSIENQVEDIVLQRGTRNILKGKEESRFPLTIGPGKHASTIISASMNRIGRIRCYLMYELVRNGRERMMIMRNYRAFLAIEVFSTTITKNCTASATVFIVKDPKFTGDRRDVDWLHIDVLKHCRVENGSSSLKCNLAGQVLKLDVDFKSDRQARIKVVLKKTNEHYEHSPLFHRANSFA
jgi:hypothetical protein